MATFVIIINSFLILAFTEDDENQELMDLIQSFRVEASKLFGLLDISNSNVAKLKVLFTKILASFTLLHFCISCCC
jgi:hypothetical protein